jgi:hypothetical protein
MTAKRQSANVVRLVPREKGKQEPIVSQDTVDCLQVLLRRARQGQIVGLAYCAMLRERTYIVDNCHPSAG